ncbi:MAG TPA: succinate dehydrogenase assembly factor 2 [Caulobacteraceae bacterium]|jgi:antitoxin CptB|nr:succinate dehydrogenase assembly factor 2 [Caulobacteraceae bacterium]
MPDPRLEKLRYRAWRRGFREADLILGGFADARLNDLDAGEVEAFARLLDENDHDLWAWIVDGAQAPPVLEGPLLDQLRAFKPVPMGPRP